MFELDARLENETIDCGSLGLCRLLLMNDARYPWFILVPQCADVTEIHQLSQEQEQQLWQESRRLSLWMEKTFRYDKLNVAALGNVVSQLHLHHVARTSGDPAWPGPVWGHSAGRPYSEAKKEEIRQLVRDGLSD